MQRPKLAQHVHEQYPCQGVRNRECSMVGNAHVPSEPQTQKPSVPALVPNPAKSEVGQLWKYHVTSAQASSPQKHRTIPANSP
jgi:hypothetical protein